MWPKSHMRQYLRMPLLLLPLPAVSLQDWLP
jgi:hypothetical protein